MVSKKPRTRKSVPKQFCVYAIENKLNGRIYIGETGNFKKRIRDHLNTAKVGKEKDPQHYQVIHAAINKYGIENFNQYIVEYVNSDKEAGCVERFWIAELKNYGIKVYNLTDGGEGSAGRVCSEETRRKISQSNMGKTSCNKGKSFSPSTIEKIGKLNWKIVEKIREEVKIYNTPNKELATKYNVWASTIYDIVKFITWKKK